eukprot:TRINITY_DN9073_c0_g1_i1.p1 TRINITY_DN9073_c0_g1~~TRINITY_DN9073_c0_g1_i1.p1  ORF type:complete len:432 (+),score=78.36 TRINITY_DN9073_c0_g1_i1:54-1349(+)
MEIGVLFVVLLVICIAFNFNQLTEKTNHPEAFVSFQRKYLFVYALVMMADWLQGPYIYALYQSYGYEMQDIATLFIAGFLSSGVFGTFVGSVADKFGRRYSCILYGVTYGLSCLTKLSPNFSVLMFGRILGGVSTSLLFSVFEAWMVCEHRKAGFSDSLLTDTFSNATLVNGFIAIISGLIADWLANSFGFVAPFMAALGCLIVSTFVIQFSWKENYGNASFDITTMFSTAISEVTNNRIVLVLGLIQSLYEGSMYTFVFMWTPVMEHAASANGKDAHLPFGLIFATYMVCVMIGSSIFRYWSATHRVENIATVVFGVSSISFILPVLVPTNYDLVLLSFCAFELFCGSYWPSIGTMRGQYLKEDCRAALMNFFRVPLNLFVVLVLVKAGSIEPASIFTVCFLGLCCATGLQWWLSKQHTHKEYQQMTSMH